MIDWLKNWSPVQIETFRAGPYTGTMRVDWILTQKILEARRGNVRLRGSG